MRMKNFNKLLAASATLAAAGLALTGCGSKSSSGPSKQVLNWNEPSELPTMDLSKATDTISFDMLNNSMEGLLRIGKNSKVEPGIAVLQSFFRRTYIYFQSAQGCQMVKR